MSDRPESPAATPSPREFSIAVKRLHDIHQWVTSGIAETLDKPGGAFLLGVESEAIIDALDYIEGYIYNLESVEADRTRGHPKSEHDHFGCRHGGCNHTFSAAQTAPPDVFEKMRRVSTRLDEIEEANRGELWTIERLRRILATIQDATVTYGIINDDGESHTPMMVERDAIVEALYG